MSPVIRSANSVLGSNYGLQFSWTRGWGVTERGGGERETEGGGGGGGG